MLNVSIVEVRRPDVWMVFVRMRRDLWQVLRQGEAEALPRFRAECASKSVVLDVLDQLFRSKSDQMMHLPSGAALVNSLVT